MKRSNTPHRHRVIKTRLTEQEYAEFSERVSLCRMSQAEFIRSMMNCFLPLGSSQPSMGKSAAT